jgi:hypothetical protein
MRNKLFLFLILPFLFAGCVQNVRTAELNPKERIPSNTYEAYFFVAGSGDKSRAVFLIEPDSGVEVLPYSSDITSTTSSYPEAMNYMKEKRGMRPISTQKVFYKDKFIGYLLTYEKERVDREEMTVNVFEKGGKVYFSAREIFRADD